MQFINMIFVLGVRPSMRGGGRVETELVLDARAALAEPPLWVAEEDALYWSDIQAPALHWRTSKARRGRAVQLHHGRRPTGVSRLLLDKQWLRLSPDDQMMYLSDSAAATIYRYDFNGQARILGGKTVFARLEPPGVADGAAVDEQGGYRCAVHGGGCLHRYLPDGVLDLVVSLPVSQPAVCCFVGEDLRTMYVTTARENLDETALAKQPGAGGLFRLRAPVPGLRKPWKVS